MAVANPIRTRKTATKELPWLTSNEIYVVIRDLHKLSPAPHALTIRVSPTKRRNMKHLTEPARYPRLVTRAWYSACTLLRQRSIAEDLLIILTVS